MSDASDELRVVRSPHLTADQVAQLQDAPVLDPEELDAHIIDVRDGRAVYSGEALEAALGMEWVWEVTVPALPYMGPRRPLLKWHREDGPWTTDDQDEED